MRRVLLGALFCTCLLFGSAARAEQAATLIVLVADDPSDAVATRLSIDLRGLGFGVVVLGTTPENSADATALERTARTLGGIAAVRIFPAGQGSQLWVLEPATSRSVVRELLRPPGSSADPNEVALGTLELLRASMLELHPPATRSAPASTPPAAPAQTTAAPVEQLPAAPPERPDAISVMAGLSADLALRSIGPSLGGALALWFRLGGGFGARGFAALPASSAHSRLPEGDVEVRATVLGTGLSYGADQRRNLLSPHVGLGAALVRVETNGTADNPMSSRRSGTWLGGGYGLVGVGLRLSHAVQLDLDATGIVLPTPAVILVQGREVATWGAPAAIVSLGIEVSTNL